MSGRYDCAICTRTIYGVMVGCGDGTGQQFAHLGCFELRVSYERQMRYLFDALPFAVRHRWGGDWREFAEGVAAAAEAP